MKNKFFLIFLYLLFLVSLSFAQKIQYLGVENKTALIRYGVWEEKSLPTVPDKKYLFSNTPDSRLQFRFYGSSLSLVFLTSEYSGMVDIAIDGEIVSTFDLYEPDLEKYAKYEKFIPQEFLVSCSLPQKEHQVDIIVKGTKNLNSKGTNVYFYSAKFSELPSSGISLSILSSDGKIPVEKAYVEVFSGEEKLATGYSNSYGNINLTLLPPGECRINIIAIGYEDTLLSFVLSEGDYITKKINLCEKIYAKPISFIKKPTSFQPQIIKKGEILTVKYLSDKNSKNWKVNLHLYENIYQLNILKKEFNHKNGVWKLSCKIPKNLPAELYDLEVSNNKNKDIRTRAVKVIEEYKNKFYFAHLTDTHVGGPYPKSEETLKNTIEELNIISPEFIIITGDLTDNGKPKEYMELLEILSKSRVPLYLIPGNHDVEAHKDIEQLFRWKRYIGDNYYSFRYGDYNFLLLDNSSCGEGSRDTFATSDFDKEQIKWIEHTLEKNKDSKLQFLLYHIPTREDVSYVHKLADKYRIKLVLYGHGHEDRVDISGTTPTNYVETTSLAMERKYRIVKVEDDNIKFNYFDSDRFSTPAGRIKISFENSNDGIYRDNKVIIKNPLRETYDATLKFIMPKGEEYNIEGGKLYQKVAGKNYNYFYVSFTLEPQSNAEISIRAYPKK